MFRLPADLYCCSPKKEKLIPNKLRQKFSRLFLSLLLLLLPYSVCRSAQADETAQSSSYAVRGPVSVSSLHPAGMLHLSFRPEAAEVGPQGSLSLSFQSSIGNTVNRERGRYLIDAETRIFELNSEYVLREGLALSLHLPVLWRGDGVTDQAIEEWHQAFGLPRGPRANIPQDQFTFSGDNTDGTGFDLNRSGTELGNISLAAKYRLIDSADQPLVSLRSELSLPTASPQYGAEQLDIGLSLLAQQSWHDFTIYTSVSYFHYLDDSVENLHFVPNQFAGLLGLEYLLSENWSAMLACEPASAMLRHVREYPDYQIYLDVSTRYHLSRRTQLTALLRENPAPSNGTTDISFSLGLEFLLPPE
jgi:hypothetical protein